MLTEAQRHAAQEDRARRVAAICGPHSGAAKALNELNARRRAGEQVVLFTDHGAWLVGPPSKSALDQEGR